MAEEAVFDLGEELGVGGVVGGGGAEGDAGDVAGGKAGDVGAGGVGVGGEGGGLDEAGVDDVAVLGVAVAEEGEDVGGGHGRMSLLYRWGAGLRGEGFGAGRVYFDCEPMQMNLAARNAFVLRER